MIRTLIETREGRVTINEDAEGVTVTIGSDSAPSIDPSERDRLMRQVRELGDRCREYDRDRTTERDRADQNKAWAERAEKNGSALSAALVTAEKALGESRELVTFKNKVADEIEEEAERLRGKVIELRDSVAARDRLLTEATTRAKDMSNRLAEAENDLEKLALQIGKVNGAVHSPTILSALRTDWTSWTGLEAVALANAVREVRLAIGSPEPGTSQA